ncbi:MAG: HD domain-containing protein [Christensenellales bacterium]|jgi:metal-dependent HD superfamily phosphatase/phosphodiesterase
MITLKDVKNDPEIKQLISSANHVLSVIGYTEHGPRHVGYVSRTSAEILKELGYDERTVELAAIAGWVHDVGNAVNRDFHGVTGAQLIYHILVQRGMPYNEVCKIISAVGNHEERNGRAVSEISAALILADKSDAHRTRVHRGQYDPADIHDRVNYAIRDNKLIVNREQMIIRYDVQMDDTSSILEFMQIYLTRMRMSEAAAKYLGCRFQFVVNDVVVNNLMDVDEAPAQGVVIEGE